MLQQKALKLESCEKNNFNAIMTSNMYWADRVAEASKKINSNIFINVPGDEPVIKTAI